MRDSSVEGDTSVAVLWRYSARLAYLWLHLKKHLMPLPESTGGSRRPNQWAKNQKVLDVVCTFNQSVLAHQTINLAASLPLGIYEIPSGEPATSSVAQAGSSSLALFTGMARAVEGGGSWSLAPAVPETTGGVQRERRVSWVSWGLAKY
ncbi:hypothetical protein INR49_011285 [Caranx melampygus]|nr:hypothetical protein INR49_011285 [Caranx melampygus]